MNSPHISSSSIMHSLLYCFLLVSLLILHCDSQEKRVYVVYMGANPAGYGSSSTTAMHHSILHTITGRAKSSLIYSYGRSFNGFAAKLSDDQVAKLKGITPESDSFSDVGFGPPPTKWKGKCQTELNFTCNNKIIGARFYLGDDSYTEKEDIKSPRDSEGHGTHTASIAAGREVSGASYYGLGEGIARGGLPHARIAEYKVCWSFGCSTADILAAFDDAIADGVDIISISIGTDYPLQYLQDPIAIGSFHAMKHGILTSNSAGNSGPWLGSVANYSPWSLTVAASSIDRKFLSRLVLGNGEILMASVINNIELNKTSFPLIWGGDAVNVSAHQTSLTSRECLPGYLDSRKIEGKIVLCEVLDGGSGVTSAGGIGIIMPAPYFNDFGTIFPLPTALIKEDDFPKVLEYIRSTKTPEATILAGETWKDIMAPTIVSFSSRGPNPITPDILKPDITAPGVDILAAWSPLASPSNWDGDTRKVKYNFLSGTSMSCPHASGAASYVKATHPTWSPAAIKSALMTTALIMDPRKNSEKEFAYGSGHINPVKAVDPGLVFDASEKDYINFLCTQGYNTSTLRNVTGDQSVCTSTKPGRAWDLNYPSFSLPIVDGHKIKGFFTRTVTNVGSPNSTYNATTHFPSPLNVIVEPSLLSFADTGEKKSFVVKVSGPAITQEPIISGSIIWGDGFHIVRTPLVVYTVLESVFSTPFHVLPQHKKKSTMKGSSIYHRNGIFV